MTTDFAGIDFPAGHALARRRKRAGARAGACAGRSRAWSPASASAWTRRTAEPGAVRGPHHVLRARLAALLPHRDGDAGRAARQQPAPDELLLPVRPPSSPSTCCSPTWSTTWTCTRRSRIAAAVSVSLVVSYLRARGRHALRAAARRALAQLVFLVLFSYAFFFEGYTGLTVTVGAVLTLFVLMQVLWDRPRGLERDVQEAEPGDDQGMSCQLATAAGLPSGSGASRRRGSTTIVSPSPKRPASTSTASGFSIMRWIVRLSGRAPKTGS